MSSKPARGPNATVLHVPIECNAEVALPSQSGKRAQPGKRSRAIGLAVAGSRATHSAFIAVGPELPSTVSLATTQLSAAASASCYPLSSLHQIHAKPELLAKGRLTIEVRLGSTVHTVFVKDAKPSALAQLYRALKAGRERAKGSDGLSGAAGLELLREFFPQQAKAAAAAAARPTEEGLPQPVKGHVRLMMVAEAVGSTPGQAGRRAADALMRGLGLRLAPGSNGGRAEEGGYSASLLAPAEEAGVGKPAPPKGASAKPVVTLRTAQCAHHKLSAPCWVEADIDTERLSPPRELGATPAAAVEALLARAIAPEAAKPLHTACVLPHRSVRTSHAVPSAALEPSRAHRPASRPLPSLPSPPGARAPARWPHLPPPLGGPPRWHLLHALRAAERRRAALGAAARPVRRALLRAALDARRADRDVASDVQGGVQGVGERKGGARPRRARDDARRAGRGLLHAAGRLADGGAARLLRAARRGLAA